FCGMVPVDPGARFQVTAECEPTDQMQHVPWFVLPPLEEFYYKSKNPQYQPLPPFAAGCDPGGDSNPMELIYPKQPTRILVPVDLDGKPSRTVFSVAHRRPETTIYWHIDGEYIGSTVTFHSMELNPPEGKHILTLVDADGRRLVQPFEILKK
ncbi:MAG TPA: penicillin-binding protein 1C, partial [Flavilitoribacter sp.]|nr:penicillin-binding protein 1C [Flavilitoribacter sp.]